MKWSPMVSWYDCIPTFAGKVKNHMVTPAENLQTSTSVGPSFLAFMYLTPQRAEFICCSPSIRVMPSAAFLRGPISNTVLFTCHVFMSPCELRPAARNNSWNYCWSHFKVDSSVHTLRQHASRKCSIIKPWRRSRFLIFKDFCLLSKCFPLPRCFPLRSVRMNLIILTLRLLLLHHKLPFPFLGKGEGKGSNRQDFTCSPPS